jgi:exopolyphosphatase/guanosine-5'-triphosphate,3'-diphosphate pyrophosphatase
MSVYIRTSAPPTSRIAAIDIGSNSLHMVVTSVDTDGQLRILDFEKAKPRLVEHLDTRGNLDAIGRRKLYQTLSQMNLVAKRYKATTRAVATHALREAKNSGPIRADIKKRLGIDVEVIDGQEEARLSFLGMRYALPLESSICLGLDIGGGSTEVIVGRRDEIRSAVSMKVGAVNLTQKIFLNGKKIKASSIERAIAEIELIMAPALEELKRDGLRWTQAVATSGTAKALAHVHARLFRDNDIEDVNGYSFPSKDLKVMVKALHELKQPKRIREAFGVDLNRAGILLAGASIFQIVTEKLGVKEWVISTGGLREGIAIDSFRRIGSTKMGRISDIKRASVNKVLSSYDVDVTFGKEVAQEAEKLFAFFAAGNSKLASVSKWSTEVEFLKCVAFLHEAGKFISSQAYHKHSSYILQNTEIVGFTQDERKLMSAICFFHRKTYATPLILKKQGFSREQIRVILRASLVLRLAVFLCRHKLNVKRVIKSRNGSIRLMTQKSQANERSAALFQKVNEILKFIELEFGTKVTFSG